MWYRDDALTTIQRFLPPTAKVVEWGAAPNRRPAVGLVDLDGDDSAEIVGVYDFRGEHYLTVLKYYESDWYVADTVKGKGYNITSFGAAPIKVRSRNNLVVGWQVGAIWSDLSIYEWTEDGLKDLVEGNKYYSMIDVEDVEGAEGRDGVYELALWKHDTGDAYKVEVYRFRDNQFVLPEDVYAYYFRKVEDYYQRLLQKKDSTTYWYYLADAQIKTGKRQEALASIERALAFDYPYPSREVLMALKRNLCPYEPFKNQDGIDFTALTYVCSETERDVRLEEALKKEFQLPPGEKIRYFYNKIDLNNDGNPEVFVYLVGSYVCGTGGCSGAIFNQKNGEYQLLSRFSLVRNPVIISSTKTNGYRDIILYVAGGGIESFFARLKFDGKSYPMNPSVQSKVEPGTKVEGVAIAADDLAKSQGIVIP
ncbi:tetratricopeptide repeat protein [Halobacillus mangrovi]|uniref:Tetratricopeptide repeat protein n=1 Tax=Halobacillus mangrovi TaxID=402384 RepID=A0A1W5ZQX1_9BACI|nr:tetratricopeptide repeat protein [Halobacillus mangrovi]ARI75694.1 hypothetical protein HM131_02115 [Halobacillus mangrovi]